MPILKFATFNVENLFSRPKVLNFYNHNNGDEKLKLIADLQHELEQPAYDKPKIINLYQQVKDYITLNVIRSKVGKRIIYKHRGAYRVVPKGSDDWFGYVEYKRDKFDDQTMDNIARVIKDINAHVICIIEVENREVLKAFNSQNLNRKYPYNMLIDGNDPRGIDISIYSKLKLGEIHTNIFDGPANSRTFSRDCLEVEVITDNGESIYFLVNHFKSKSGSNQEDNDKRRRRQTERVSQILQDRYDLRNQKVVVAGDFNDTPNSAPLQPLLGNNRLHDVLALQFPNDPQERWTYHYTQNEQIDYILVSDALRNSFRQAGVWRKGISKVDVYSGGQIQPYPTVTTWRNAASDHGAVWAEFDF
jgi:predicted extracellular nuclease